MIRIHQIKCGYCGLYFGALRKTRKFCSVECWREHEKLDPPRKKTKYKVCPGCLIRKTRDKYYTKYQKRKDGTKTISTRSLCKKCYGEADKFKYASRKEKTGEN